jgi:histone H3/H4
MEFAKETCKIAIAEILRMRGIDRISASTLNVLLDVCERYQRLLASVCTQCCNNAGRTQVNSIDIFAALEFLDIDVFAVEDYLRTLVNQKQKMTEKNKDVRMGFPRIEPAVFPISLLILSRYESSRNCRVSR